VNVGSIRRTTFSKLKLRIKLWVVLGATVARRVVELRNGSPSACAKAVENNAAAVNVQLILDRFLREHAPNVGVRDAVP
jgi:hypothetical protein